MLLNQKLGGKLGRKGMFLSLIAMLIVTLFAFVLTLQNITVSSYKADVIRTRVSTVNDYVKSLFDVYIPNAAETSVYYALDYIATHDDVSYEEHRIRFIRAGIRKILEDGTPIYIEELKDKNIEYWFGQINKTSTEYLGVDTKIDVTKIILTQQDPWHINVTLNVTVIVDAGLAHWDSTRLVETRVSIIGLRDKLVVNNVYGGNEIYISNIVDGKLVDDFPWGDSQSGSLSQLGKIMEADAFVHSLLAPSYLNRLEKPDDPAPSPCCGIMSFAEADVYVDKKSSADYCYYNDLITHETGCGPQVFYCLKEESWLILSSQQAHGDFFNVVGECTSIQPQPPLPEEE